MTASSTPSEDGQPRDAAYWAQQASNLKVARMPTWRCCRVVAFICVFANLTSS